jgi:hypothetical protein
MDMKEAIFTMAFRPTPAVVRDNVDVRSLVDAMIKGDIPMLSANSIPLLTHVKDTLLV